jgi:CBS domain containing-hemolysin-like protein
MQVAILIAVYFIILYLSFTVNVFQVGLYLHDDAGAEAFDKMSESKRHRLGGFFSDLPTFNDFVGLFNSLSDMALATIALWLVFSVSSASVATRAIESVAALAVTVVLNHILAQKLSKKVSNKWVDTTLINRIDLVSFLKTALGPAVSAIGKLADRYEREQMSDGQKEDMVERAIESFASSAGLDEPLVEEEEKEMIGNIFELDQTSVKEIMVPRTEIVSIPMNSSFEDVKRIVLASGHSRFPVPGENLDDIKGIIYVKDLFAKCPLPEVGFDVLQHIRKPFFVPETTRTSDLLNQLKRTRNHIAMVADEYGGTAGLITMEDVIELIVGDIQDEHDVEEAQIVSLEDATYRVDANTSVEMLAEHAGVEIESDSFQTVGGLIYDLVGSLPREGQTVVSTHFELTVEKMEGQRIEKVRVRLLKGNSQ